MDRKILSLIKRNILDEPEFYDEAEPLRYKRLEEFTSQAFSDVKEKIESSDKEINITALYEAVDGLDELTSALKNQAFEIGVATGLHLHNELMKLLNNPLNSMKKMFDTEYLSFRDMHEKDLKRIESFIEKRIFI